MQMRWNIICEKALMKLTQRWQYAFEQKKKVATEYS